MSDAGPSVVNERREFKTAWRSLLSLQSTGTALERSFQRRSETLHMMRFYVRELGIDVQALSRRVIHVAGTKGKGSTCAFAESVLRARGYRTALFTSPHLVHVRERFRVNGAVVSEDIFLQHFWAVWDGLHAAKARADEAGVPPVPSFFRFLTLIAFRMFLSLSVDVVLLEVGLGGRLDATNVVPAPACIGVATLDYDHTHILGNTLAEIAFEKAGVFKPGVPCFSVPQTAEAMSVLRQRAMQVGCDLRTVRPERMGIGPAFGREGSTGGHCDPTVEPAGADVVHLGLQGDHQRLNAALALALCDSWLQQRPDVMTRSRGWHKKQLQQCQDSDRGGQEGYEAEGDELRLREEQPMLKRPALVLKEAPDARQAKHARCLSPPASPCRTVCLQAAKDLEREQQTKPIDEELDHKTLQRLQQWVRDPRTRVGLEQCRWPGRSHILQLPLPTSSLPAPHYGGAGENGTKCSNNDAVPAWLFLDGAHTAHSMVCCRTWFAAASRHLAAAATPATSRRAPTLRAVSGAETTHVRRLSIFCCSHERNPIELLRPLLKSPCPFECCIFCPADAGRPSRLRKKSATELLSDAGFEVSDLAPDGDDVAWPETLCTVAKAILRHEESDRSSSECVTAPSAAEAIEMVRSRLHDAGDSVAVHVLVSGSLYVVGSVLDAVKWSAAESIDSDDGKVNGVAH